MEGNFNVNNNRSQRQPSTEPETARKRQPSEHIDTQSAADETIYKGLAAQREISHETAFKPVGPPSYNFSLTTSGQETIFKDVTGQRASFAHQNTSSVNASTPQFFPGQAEMSIPPDMTHLPNIGISNPTHAQAGSHNAMAPQIAQMDISSRLSSLNLNENIPQETIEQRLYRELGIQPVGVQAQAAGHVTPRMYSQPGGRSANVPAPAPPPPAGVSSLTGPLGIASGQGGTSRLMDLISVSNIMQDQQRQQNGTFVEDSISLQGPQSAGSSLPSIASLTSAAGLVSHQCRTPASSGGNLPANVTHTAIDIQNSPLVDKLGGTHLPPAGENRAIPGHCLVNCQPDQVIPKDGQNEKSGGRKRQGSEAVYNLEARSRSNTADAKEIDFTQDFDTSFTSRTSSECQPSQYNRQQPAYPPSHTEASSSIVSGFTDASVESPSARQSQALAHAEALLQSGFSLPTNVPPSNFGYPIVNKEAKMVFHGLMKYLNSGQFDTFFKFTVQIRPLMAKDNDVYFVVRYLESCGHMYRNDQDQCRQCIIDALRVVPKTSSPSKFKVDILAIKAWLDLTRGRLGHVDNTLRSALQTYHQHKIICSGKVTGWIHVQDARYAQSQITGDLVDEIHLQDAITSYKLAIEQFEKEIEIGMIEEGIYGYIFCSLKLLSLLLGRDEYLKLREPMLEKDGHTQALELLIRVLGSADSQLCMHNVNLRIAVADYAASTGELAVAENYVVDTFRIAKDPESKLFVQARFDNLQKMRAQGVREGIPLHQPLPYFSELSEAECLQIRANLIQRLRILKFGEAFNRNTRPVDPLSEQYQVPGTIVNDNQTLMQMAASAPFQVPQSVKCANMKNPVTVSQTSITEYYSPEKDYADSLAGDPDVRRKTSTSKTLPGSVPESALQSVELSTNSSIAPEEVRMDRA